MVKIVFVCVSVRMVLADPVTDEVRYMVTLF